MKTLYYITLLFFGLNSFSQSLLTKEQALNQLLENNYDVRLSKNEIRIAENNTSIYNSKYLPTVSVGAGANYSNMNQEIETQTGMLNTIDNAETQAYNASVGLNYMLFNGFSRKYASKQLQEQLAISEIAAEATLENAVVEVYTNYYQIAQIEESVNVLKEALQISKERLKRVQYQYDYGQTSKLAVLNAQVDINNDSIRYTNTKQTLDNSKRSLLVLIGDATSTVDFNIETGVTFSVIPSLDVLLSDLSGNTNLQQLEHVLQIGDYSIEMSKAGYLPSLSLNSSYAWNNSQYPISSQFAAMMNYGFNAGLSLKWNVFDGGATKTRLQNAKINQENQLLQKEQLEHQLRNLISNTYYNYQSKRLEFQTQEANLITVENNFQRTEEHFKMGHVSSVEYRQAQLNLLNAKTAILRAKYEAKIIELRLLQLTGRLIPAN